MISKVTFINIDCDGCGDCYERSDFATLPDAKAAAKAAGWDLSRYAQGLVFCPDCVDVRARAVGLAASSTICAVIQRLVDSSYSNPPERNAP